MTRRGGRERYRPADLRRGIVRDGGSWPSRDDKPSRGPRRAGCHGYEPVACRCHGVPWLDCTVCSTTRRAA